MLRRDIVVIGASAGGVEAIRSIVALLPEGFQASLFVVVHTPQQGAGLLARVLNRSGPLTAITPSDGTRIAPGKIYVAPPRHHMLLEHGRVRLSAGPLHDRYRPAIDPLLVSAARVYGPRVLGVVLTGYLDDGAEGMAGVKFHGGLTLVQDPRGMRSLQICRGAC